MAALATAILLVSYFVPLEFAPVLILFVVVVLIITIIVIIVVFFLRRCVTVCVKILEGADATNLQADVDQANDIFAQCGLVVCLGVQQTNTRDDLLDLDRDDCLAPPNHSVSAEEQALYQLLREECPDEAVAYYVRSDDGALGCAAHPNGLPGFTVTNGQPDRLTFAHELGHILGLEHVQDLGNIMNNSANIGTALTEAQCETVLRSPLIRWCLWC